MIGIVRTYWLDTCILNKYSVCRNGIPQKTARSSIAVQHLEYQSQSNGILAWSLTHTVLNAEPAQVPRMWAGRTGRRSRLGPEWIFDPYGICDLFEHSERTRYN
jgi:hypothetical protein